MIDASFLDQLESFSLIVKKRVTSTYVGKRKSILPGKGTLIKDRRMYVPGDDFRLIDWKVYARTDKIHIKLYEEEKSLVVHVLLDNSASMQFGKLKKSEYASMLGVGYSYLTLLENEKLQFATFSEKVDVFNPKRGRAHIATMIDYLNTLKPDGTTKFLECMRYYKQYIHSRSLIVILSDFLTDPDEVKDALLLLGDHEIKLIQVLDPIERDLRLEGDYDFKDMESTEHLHTFISPKLKYEYQQRLAAHNAKLEKICDDMGVAFYSFSTDTPAFEAFYELFK